MFKIRNKKTFLSKISMVICFVIFLGFINISLIDVEAGTNIEAPGLTVRIDSITPNPAIVGENITVNGTITPQDFEDVIQKKQIVLVLDTSGSMADNSKIDNLKTAAKDFIDKMSTINNMEMGIVQFSNQASINPEQMLNFLPVYIDSNPTNPTNPTDTTNKNNLKQIITNFKANGGTNTAEGLRKAEYLFKSFGDNSAKKIIVLMSDGLPTFYPEISKRDTYSASNVYKTIDNTDPIVGGTGQDPDHVNDYYKQQATDNVNNSKAAADTIGNIIRDSNPNINVFSIGYGLGDATTLGNKTMKEMHQSMGGADDNFFLTNTDSVAVNATFDNIYNKIIDNYQLPDITVDLSAATNFTTNFSTITSDKKIYIRNVNYKGTITNNKIIYHADPIPFSFIIKANVPGNYENLFDGAKLTYPWNGQSNSVAMPNVKLQVNDSALPIINGNIVSQSPSPATRSQDITLECKIGAEKFSINSTTYDKSGPKDIIFLVDTSKSMASKNPGLTNGLFGKIFNDSNILNVKYGFVTFNSTVTSCITGGLTNNTGVLDSATKNISFSDTDDIRDVGTAMETAKDIFATDGRADSVKYLVIIGADNLKYTYDQLIDVEKENYKVITINLGYITPPQKVDNTIIPGADEPNNNIKDLHYSLIGKLDNKDNILQKEDKNYFLDINYSKVTNINNPNEFFTKEESINDINDANGNNINNWILDNVAKKIENIQAPIKTPSYTLNTKLKFAMKSKFTAKSGLVSGSDQTYEIETPEFPVTYNLINGEYAPVPDTIYKSFTINIDPLLTDLKDLKFGPGIVSYNNLGNVPTSTPIAAYPLNLKSNLQIQAFGMYKGIFNQQPNIMVSTQDFNLARVANINLGATLYGSLSTDANMRLEIPDSLIINNDIVVYTYDDNGNLTKVGTMQSNTSANSKKIYKYSGTSVTDQKILILCNEQIPKDASDNAEFVNSLFADDIENDVKIKVNSNLPELF